MQRRICSNRPLFIDENFNEILQRSKRNGFHKKSRMFNRPPLSQVLIMKKTNTLVLYFWNAMNTKMLKKLKNGFKVRKLLE